MGKPRWRAEKWNKQRNAFHPFVPLIPHYISVERAERDGNYCIYNNALCEYNVERIWNVSGTNCKYSTTPLSKEGWSGTVGTESVSHESKGLGVPAPPSPLSARIFLKHAGRTDMADVASAIRTFIRIIY